MQEAQGYLPQNDAESHAYYHHEPIVAPKHQPTQKPQKKWKASQFWVGPPWNEVRNPWERAAPSCIQCIFEAESAATLLTTWLGTAHLGRLCWSYLSRTSHPPYPLMLKTTWPTFCAPTIGHIAKSLLLSGHGDCSNSRSICNLARESWTVELANWQALWK